MEQSSSSFGRERPGAIPPDTHVIPGAGHGGARPVIFRNSRFFIVCILIFGVAGIAIASGMAVVTFQELITPRHNLFLKALNVIQWAGSSFYTALLGVAMCRVGFQMTFYQARLDERGVDFRLGSRKNPHLQFFSWDQIAAVKHKRTSMNEYYAVIGRDHRLADFTMYTFFHAKKLARQIAAHAGQPLQEIGS